MKVRIPIVLVAAALFLLPATAAGKTFTVTNENGCGPTGTLQAAIKAANANPGADTVDFAPSVPNIGLGSCPMRSAEANIFAMYVTDDLTIQGPVAIRGLLWWLDPSGNVGNPVMPPSSATQIAVNTGFLQVGAYGDSATPVHVTINRVDVLPQGASPGQPGYWSLPAYALVNPNSSLTVNHSRIEGIIDAAQMDRSTVAPIQVGTRASFTLNDSYLYNNSFFGETARVDAIITAGHGSDVVIDRSVIYDTRSDMGAILSVGGDVQIVSSVFDNGGGVTLDGGASAAITNSAIASPRVDPGTIAGVAQQGLAVLDSTARVDASTISVEPQLSSGCPTAVRVAPASAIYESGATSDLTVVDSIVASGNPISLPDARLPIWQRRSGTATAINTWTNADQYGTSGGSDCTLVDPGATAQAPLPAGVSTGPLGLVANLFQEPFPRQGLPAFGAGSKLLAMASGPVVNQLDGKPIAYDAYATFLRVLNDFRIGGTAWPGADTHLRVAPDGLRDLGALQQLQFQSILSAVAVSGKAHLQWTEAGQAPGPITAHQVAYRLKGSSTWIAGPAAGGADTGVNVLGLTNGRTYEFRVRAIAGSFGPGPWSNIAEAIPPVPTVASIAYPDGSGVAGVPITPVRAHTGGLVGPVRWDAPSLPQGLRISPSTGTITGTAAGPGTFTALVTATDSLNTQATTFVVIVIAPASTPAVPLLRYADMTGTAGVAIAPGVAHATALSGATYTATKLPAGLRIDARTGTISGTPTRAGTSYPVVTATVGGKAVSANRFVITVLEPAVPPHVSYPVIRGQVGRPLGDVFPQVAGIVHTTTYEPTRMPSGLTVVPGAGVIRGTPRTAGTTTVVMTVYHGFDAIQTIVTITISAAAPGRYVSYPTGRVLQGRRIEPVRPHTTGVRGPRRYRAAGLPSGLRIDPSTGVITGRARKAGGSTVRVTVTGPNGSARTTVRIQVTSDPAYRPPAPRPSPPFTG